MSPTEHRNDPGDSSGGQVHPGLSDPNAPSVGTSAQASATRRGAGQRRTLSSHQKTASLGDFSLLRDFTFDVRQPLWKRRPAKVSYRWVRGRRLTVGTFHFDRVKIPSGVTVRFRGFDVMVLESSGDMLIDGILDVSGTDGKPGTDAGGGDGGNGGAAQGGALVGGLVSAVPPRRKEVN